MGRIGSLQARYAQPKVVIGEAPIIANKANIKRPLAGGGRTLLAKELYLYFFRF